MRSDEWQRSRRVVARVAKDTLALGTRYTGVVAPACHITLQAYAREVRRADMMIRAQNCQRAYRNAADKDISSPTKNLPLWMACSVRVRRQQEVHVTPRRCHAHAQRVKMKRKAISAAI